MVITENIKAEIIGALMPYKPTRIGIFGSYARNEPTPESDMDVLFAVTEKIGLLKVVAIQQTLEERFGVKFDLVMENVLKNKYLRDSI